MNKIFKLIILISLVLISATFFICQPKYQNNEVVFWTLQMSDFAPYINGVISDFENENPKIKIKWVDVPFSEGEKRTLASVLSDNPPDLVNLNPDFSAILAYKGALYEIPENMTEQFNKEIINSIKTNNKLYSIPWYATSAVTIYNHDLIKNPPVSYHQAAKVAENIRQKGAYIMLPNITENDTMLKILNKYGLSDPNLINSDKSVRFFNMFADLYDKDLIPKEAITITLQEALGKYMSGNVAVIEAGANFLNMIRENSPSIYEKTDVSKQLTGDMGQYNFSLMNFVIPIKAKNKDEALKFALFLTNDKNQLELAKLTNILAVNETTLENDFYKKYDNGDLVGKARVISAGQLDKLQPVFRSRKNQKDINNLVNTAVQNILLQKDDTKNILNNLKINLKTLEEK